MGYDWRQRKMRLLFGVAIVACVIALVRPAIARAGWPLEGSGAVLLGFGASYTSAEATSASTHRGIDIAAEAGASVVAPLAGRVTFSGRVPAAGGGTCRAVTIATDVGSVTLLPLASARVAKGDTLAEGEAVGSLAESGDGSSAGTHLHVGVKRGDVYVDPLSVLSATAVARGDSSDAQPEASGRAQQEGTHAPKAADGATAQSGNGALASRSAAPLRAPIPGTAVAPGVSIAGDAGVSRQVAGGSSGAAAAPAPTTAASASSGVAERSAPSVAEWLSSLATLALSATKAASLSTFALLAAVGALWPLWRRGGRKGLGEDRVSTAGDDVAAVVGR